MNLATAIRTAVPVLARHGHGDSVMLQALLRGSGLSQAQAHDAVRFIPLAFGREILSGLGVTLPDTYICVIGDRREEKRLKDEPFFRGADTLVRILASDYGSDVITAIAMQSAELDAVNQALHAGSDPADLVAGPPVIECEDIPRPPKPWWKFWE